MTDSTAYSEINFSIVKFFLAVNILFVDIHVEILDKLYNDKRILVSSLSSF